MIRVLFICHGNICRSPMAEFILKDIVTKRGIADQFEIASAATSTEEIWNGVGNPVYPPAREELARHGISCKGKRAVQLTASDYDHYDYLIGMDSMNMRNIERMTGHRCGDKIYKMLEFAAWWQAQKSEPAKIQIEACEGVTDGQVDSYAAEAEAVQSLLQRRFGQTLRGSYTLVLASGKEEFAQAVSARSDMTFDEARKNVGESLWLENGSTVFLDAAALDSRRQQIFSMGVMITRVMEAQAMGGTEQEVAWLARGTAYLIGTLRLSEEGLGSFEDYRRSWLSVLQEQGRFPDGADLTAPKSYEQSVASFGDESCSLVAELTAHDLLARRGWGSFAKWMRATSLAGGDGEKAFRSTYGEGASAYASAASTRLLREVQDMYTR